MKEFMINLFDAIKWFFIGFFRALFVVLTIASLICSLILVYNLMSGGPLEWYIIASPAMFCVLGGIHCAWETW